VEKACKIWTKNSQAFWGKMSEKYQGMIYWYLSLIHPNYSAHLIRLMQAIAMSFLRFMDRLGFSSWVTASYSCKNSGELTDITFFDRLTRTVFGPAIWRLNIKVFVSLCQFLLT